MAPALMSVGRPNRNVIEANPMSAPAHDVNDAVRESPAPGVCPMHGIAMDHRRIWSSGHAWICPACDAHIRARRAWLDELPEIADPFEALVALFSDPRV
jgi:hypothetical protein